MTKKPIIIIVCPVCGEDKFPIDYMTYERGTVFVRQFGAYPCGDCIRKGRRDE